MKKIITIFCEIIALACPCFTYADNYANKDAEYKKFDWYMLEDISSEIDKRKITVANNNLFKYEKRDTEWGQIPMVHIAAAKDIYTHGAEICKMIIQHIDGKWKPWIDLDSCSVMCKDGFYGPKCESQIASANTLSCDDKNFIHNFSVLGGVKDNGLTNDAITTFGQDYWGVIPLVVIERHEHSVTVQPIYIGATDGKIQSIDVAYYHGTNQTQGIELYAQGYTKEGRQTKCTSCAAGEGLNSTSDHTCIKCDGFNGVNSNGVCKQCLSGEKFSKKHDDCWQYRKLSRFDMRKNSATAKECWIETNPDNYKNCVLDISAN